MELEHSFQVPSPDVQLCVADNVLVVLHWASASALLFDVCSTPSERLQPITVPVDLTPTPDSGVRSECSDKRLNMANHSDDPNSVQIATPNAVHLQAQRDIAKGQEVGHCRGDWLIE